MLPAIEPALTATQKAVRRRIPDTAPIQIRFQRKHNAAAVGVMPLLVHQTGPLEITQRVAELSQPTRQALTRREADAQQFDDVRLLNPALLQVEHCLGMTMYPSARLNVVTEPDPLPIGNATSPV